METYDIQLFQGLDESLKEEKPRFKSEVQFLRKRESEIVIQGFKEVR